MPTTIHYICGNNSTTTLTKSCPICSARTDFILDRGRYEAWRGGQLIQNVFPEMKPEDRETLCSGFCQPCWDKHIA